MAVDDAYTKSLLHYDGPDGSTTFTDESGKTWTAAGNAQIDTGQSVFGGASGLFDGTGDYISTPDHDDFTPGTGNATVDFRVRFNSLPSTTGDSMCLWTHYQNSSNLIQMIIWKNSGAGSFTIAVSRIGGSAFEYTKSATLAINTWYHAALVKDGSDWEFFLDGTSLGTTSGTDTWPNIAGSFYIAYISTCTFALNGWMDEFRFSNGVARWTANFTPPSSEYAGDVSVTPAAATAKVATVAPTFIYSFTPATSTAKAATVAPTFAYAVIPLAATAKTATSGGAFVIPFQLHAAYRDFNTLGQERDYSLSAPYRSFRITAPEV